MHDRSWLAPGVHSLRVLQFASAGVRTRTHTLGATVHRDGGDYNLLHRFSLLPPSLRFPHMALLTHYSSERGQRMDLSR